MFKILIKTALFLFLHSEVMAITASVKLTVAHVEFEETERYVIDNVVLHKVVRVRVTNASWRPVPFIPVHLSSSDPEIADFIFDTVVTDSSGLAVTVIQSKVSADTIVSPPEEFRNRIPLITATAGGVKSDEVQVEIWWGVIVEPAFVGPHFNGAFKSFLDTTEVYGDTLILQGELFAVWGPIPPPDFMFRTYSTDPRIARVDSAVVDSNLVTITIHCLKEGQVYIIVDGVPPAVIGIRVHSPTEVREEIQTLYTPTVVTLEQNYPNPFNPETTINYQLPKATEVKLQIYNLLGQRVVTLVDRQQPAGFYSAKWDGRDDAGKNVASGIYLYQLKTEGFVKVRKLTLLR